MTNYFKADYLGAFASLLCLVHCLATPFLFVVKTCAHTCCVNAPVWWKAIDYLFLIISFICIYCTKQDRAKRSIKVALWSAWTVLLFTVLNETLDIVLIPEQFIYIPSLVIAVLHLYNRQYCQCVTMVQCTKQGS